MQRYEAVADPNKILYLVIGHRAIDERDPVVNAVELLLETLQGLRVAAGIVHFKDKLNTREWLFLDQAAENVDDCAGILPRGVGRRVPEEQDCKTVFGNSEIAAPQVAG